MRLTPLCFELGDGPTVHDLHCMSELLAGQVLLATRGFAAQIEETVVQLPIITSRRGG